MRALIPSGGAGTRLRPITNTGAKQLVPVANKPILFYVLDDIVEAGVTDIGIVVGDTAAEIRDAVGDGSRWGARVTYIEQDAPRGLAHTVLIARDFLADEPFVMYLGDNMLRDGITGIVESFGSDRPSAQILVARVPQPQRFGVVEVDGDKVVRLIEKPSDPPSDLALVGVYLFDPLIHEAVRAIDPSTRGELEITDAIQWLVDQGRPVRYHIVEGWWKDTGRPVDLLDANRHVLEDIAPSNAGHVDDASQIIGTVVIEEGAVLESTTVRGPAIIGAGTRLRDSFIGPYTSIGPGCTIEDSEVEHSVILADCVIGGVHRLEDSILGRGVLVERGTTRPKAYRLMIGDSGRVEVD